MEEILHQVVYPIIYKVSYIQPVVVWDDFHQSTILPTYLGRYPWLPQTQGKKFLQKLLVNGQGYLPGVCGWDLWKSTVLLWCSPSWGSVCNTPSKATMEQSGSHPNFPMWRILRDPNIGPIHLGWFNRWYGSGIFWWQGVYLIFLGWCDKWQSCFFSWDHLRFNRVWVADDRQDTSDRFFLMSRFLGMENSTDALCCVNRSD